MPEAECRGKRGNLTVNKDLLLKSQQLSRYVWEQRVCPGGAPVSPWLSCYRDEANLHTRRLWREGRDVQLQPLLALPGGAPDCGGKVVPYSYSHCWPFKLLLTIKNHGGM